MSGASGVAIRLASALAIGLLIGAERERRKGEGASRSPAGIRTFAIASLVGATSVLIGNEWLLAVSVLGVAVLSAVAYWRSDLQDPGLTSEIALVLTVLLGGLALRDPRFAAGLAVAVAVLLAARERIHHFVRGVLSREELDDALIFAAVVFVILPLVPDRYLGPFNAINPRIIWKIVALMLSISAAGYVAVRLVGPRIGLALAGLASGFVSSTATISSMGARASQEPALLRPAVAGAVLSTVATIVQLAVVLAAISLPTLNALTVPLIAGGIAALFYGLFFTLRTLRADVSEIARRGRAFSLKTAMAFAATIALMLMVSAGADAWLGNRGVLAAAALAGFADVHATTVSVASLVASTRIGVNDAMVPILAGFTTNTLMKVVLAIASGSRRFAFQVIPGLILVLLTLWLATTYGKWFFA